MKTKAKQNKQSSSSDVESKKKVNETNIFVKNLPRGFNTSSLQNYFGAFGHIVSHRIISKRNVAFINFKSSAEANNAINNMNDFDMDGKLIRCELSRNAFIASSTSENFRSTKKVNFHQARKFHRPPARAQNSSSLKMKYIARNQMNEKSQHPTTNRKSDKLASKENQECSEMILDLKQNPIMTNAQQQLSPTVMCIPQAHYQHHQSQQFQHLPQIMVHQSQPQPAYPIIMGSQIPPHQLYTAHHLARAQDYAKSNAILNPLVQFKQHQQYVPADPLMNPNIRFTTY